MQREQIELATVPHTSMAALGAELAARRKEVASAALAHGARPAALATYPLLQSITWRMSRASSGCTSASVRSRTDS